MSLVLEGKAMNADIDEQAVAERLKKMGLAREYPMIS